MPTDCLDGFKMGCDTCGNAPCCCGNAKQVVSDSKGDCVPLLLDPNHIFSHNCKAPQGGDKTVGAPQYFLSIENPPDDVCRNPDGTPIIVDGQVVNCSQ